MFSGSVDSVVSVDEHEAAMVCFGCWLSTSGDIAIIRLFNVQKVILILFSGFDRGHVYADNSESGAV
jgi:hypothetical protein